MTSSLMEAFAFYTAEVTPGLHEMDMNVKSGRPRPESGSRGELQRPLCAPRLCQMGPDGSVQREDLWIKVNFGG